MYRPTSQQVDLKDIEDETDDSLKITLLLEYLEGLEYRIIKLERSLKDV